MTKYLYIEILSHGIRVRRDIPGTCSKEGAQYDTFNIDETIRRFRADFDCKGQHFTWVKL